MGCNNSKLDSLPAVTLCRDRCQYLDRCLNHSYALANAHIEYMHSLKHFGHSLHRFFEKISENRINFPNPKLPSVVVASPDHTSSSSARTSDSHIHFDTDSEEEIIPKENAPSRTLSGRFIITSPVYDHSFRNYINTPSPPQPNSSTWDFLNFFDPYDVKYCSENIGRNEKLFQENCDNKDEKMGEKEKEKEKTKSVTVEEVSEKPKEKKRQKYNVVEHEVDGSTKCVWETMSELRCWFEKASESGHGVLELLDVTKSRHCHYEDDFSKTNSSLASGNLSSTLEVLCMWEKKLYNEVKEEEKMRIIYGKKCRELKYLSEKDGDASKIDSTLNVLNALSIRMKIAFHVIDKISASINKLRDEELWQCIDHMICRLVDMWKAMEECHKCQHQAISDAKNLDTLITNLKLDDAHLEELMQLKLELQSWTLCFSNWIDTQKACVKSLNHWLMRCLPYKPEDIATDEDNAARFSPSEMGAPPVFITCNKWSEALGGISEKGVISSMKEISRSWNQILMRHYLSWQEKAIADKEMERKLRMFERKEQQMQKFVQVKDKRLVLVSDSRDSSLILRGRVVGSYDVSCETRMQSGFKDTFEALEKFCAESVKTCEELCALAEGYKKTQEDADISV